MRYDNNQKQQQMFCHCSIGSNNDSKIYSQVGKIDTATGFPGIYLALVRPPNMIWIVLQFKDVLVKIKLIFQAKSDIDKYLLIVLCIQRNIMPFGRFESQILLSK